MKILIADDDQDLRDIIKKFVKGNEVYTASNGLEALSIAKEITPELIISDTMMPCMDGPEFLDKYTSENPVVKTILMSGKPLSYLKDIYPSASKYVFLKKPFRYSEFKQVFSEVTKTA